MKKKWSILALSVVLATSGVIGAQAQLDKILKGGGIALLISQFGGEINKALNRLTNTSDKDPKFATKVVPVLSAGTGAYAGAVQVAGPRDAVNKVQAVAQIEGNFGPLGMRIRALIPIATKSVTNIRRIPGVGVSGLLDVKL